MGRAFRERALASEANGGNEVIAAVIVIAFVLGLGAALMGTQGAFNTAITDAGTDASNLFDNLTDSIGDGTGE